MSIESFEENATTLTVFVSGETDPVVVPWFWVRDNSRDETSVDPTTGQRTIDTFALDLDVTPDRVELVRGDLVVHWSDGVVPSVLPEHLLREPPGKGTGTRATWRSPVVVDSVPFAEVVDTDAGLMRWLESIERHGFGMVCKTPGDIESAEALAERVGYVSQTVFGGMWTLSSENTEHADSAYSDTFLEPHTDGSYFHLGPGLQMFSCSERTGEGGESVLVDGFAAVEALRRESPEAFSILTEVHVPAHYIEPGVDLRASRPTIRLAPSGDIEQVTFNNYDRSPSLLSPSRMRDWYEAYRALHALITDRSSWLVHRLEPGDTLLFDNWRCLHGRMSYSGRRVFHGCYLDRADFESRLRVLRS